MPVPTRNRLLITLFACVFAMSVWGVAWAVRKNIASEFCAQLVNVSGVAADGGSTTLYYWQPGFAGRSTHGVTPSHYGGGLWCVNVSAGVMNNSAVSLQFVNATAVPVNLMVFPVGYDETQTYLLANVTQIGGASVSTSTAQIGVNVVNISAGAITNSAVASAALTPANFSGVFPTNFSSGQISTGGVYMSNVSTVAGTSQTGGDLYGGLSNVSGNVNTIVTKTASLPYVNVTAGTVTSVTNPVTVTGFVNVSAVTGDITGSVASVTNPVTVTGFVNVSAVSGNVTGSVGSVTGLSTASIWNYAASNASNGTMGGVLANTTASAGLTAQQVVNAMFNLSGGTYATASAGSPVWEIVSNISGGGSLSYAGIWNYAAANASNGTMGGVLANTTASAGLTANDIWAHASAVQINTAIINTSSLASAIKAKTDILPFVNVTAGTVTSVTNPVTVTGYVNVSAVTGAVQSVTNPVSVTGFVNVSAVSGNVTGSVGSVLAGVTSVSVTDKTGYSLSTAGVSGVVDEIDSRHGPGPYTK